MTVAAGVTQHFPSKWVFTAAPLVFMASIASAKWQCCLLATKPIEFEDFVRAALATGKAPPASKSKKKKARR